MADSTNLGQINQIAQSQADSSTESLKQGIGLYQQVQDVQQKSAQLDAMKDQLDTQKFNKATSNLSLLARTNPTIAKRMVPKIGDQLRAAGIPVDQGVLDTLASDDAYKARFQAVGDALSGLATDPAGRAQALQAFGDLGEFDKGLSALESNNKLATQAQIAEQKAKQAETVANIQAGGRVAAAQVTGGTKVDLAEARAVKNITTDPVVVGLTKSINQAKKDFDLIEGAKKNGITPLKAHELIQSYVGLLKGQASGSVGAERESLENSALDAETRYNSFLQKFKPNGIIKYQDAPFLNEIESSVREIHGTLKGSLGTRTDELTRNSGIGSVNDVQKAARDKLLAGADLGQNGEAARDKLLAGADLGQNGEAAPHPVQTMSPDARAQAIKTAKAAGYSDEDIQKYLKANGG